MKNLMTILIVGVTFMAIVSGHAHHSFTADYNREKSATIEGTVTEFWFENPHTRIYMEVKNENGEMEAWEVETMTPNVLRRMGWRPDTFKPGQKLTAAGSLARNGANRISLSILTLEDGTQMKPMPTDEQRDAFYDQEP